jgi:hypothetical protein
LAISDGAEHLIDAVRSRDWSTALGIVDKMKTAWDAVRAGEVPKMLAAQMTDALEAVVKAVNARRAPAAGRAAVEAAEATLDLQLRYRASTPIDRARFALRVHELVLDAATGDSAAVRGDVATLVWIRGRITIGSADASRVDHQLRSLKAAVGAGELDSVIHAAVRLQHIVPR